MDNLDEILALINTSPDKLSSRLHDNVVLFTEYDYAEIIIEHKNGLEDIKIKIDLDDVERVKPFRWGFNYNSEMAFTQSKHLKSLRINYLHRYILQNNRDKIVFINGDKSDCRKSNLSI